LHDGDMTAFSKYLTEKISDQYGYFLSNPGLCISYRLGEEGSKLFRRVQHTKNGWQLKKQGMSYSRANQLLKAELKKEGLNVSRYSLHSLRAGGASAAAALGVPDRLFQQHGGWRSETAKNNYLEESLDSSLLVTKSIQDKNT
ncbi:Integrase recombinase xerD-like, partial [Paramuricea clavata]